VFFCFFFFGVWVSCVVSFSFVRGFLGVFVFFFPEEDPLPDFPNPFAVDV